MVSKTTHQNIITFQRIMSGVGIIMTGYLLLTSGSLLYGVFFTLFLAWLISSLFLSKEIK
jgi:hypothetical protein